MPDDLLPCAFCGAPGAIDDCYPEGDGWAVFMACSHAKDDPCHMLSVNFRVHDEKEARLLAVAAWNKRHGLPRSSSSCPFCGANGSGFVEEWALGFGVSTPAAEHRARFICGQCGAAGPMTAAPNGPEAMKAARIAWEKRS